MVKKNEITLYQDWREETEAALRIPMKKYVDAKIQRLKRCKEAKVTVATATNTRCLSIQVDVPHSSP